MLPVLLYPYTQLAILQILYNIGTRTSSLLVYPISSLLSSIPGSRLVSVVQS
jgi:hypothetical protein